MRASVPRQWTPNRGIEARLREMVLGGQNINDAAKNLIAAGMESMDVTAAIARTRFKNSMIEPLMAQNLTPQEISKRISRPLATVEQKITHINRAKRRAG